jgi:hypothetical protein
MSDLIAKINAKLDAEELAARDAIKQSHTSRRLIDGQMVAVPIRPSRWRGAAWPPERVLRQVTAHRKILELHAARLVTLPGWDSNPDTPWCGECNARFPCPTLLALAEAYGIEP